MHTTQQKGQILLVAVLFVVIGSLLIISGVSIFVTSKVKTTTELIMSKESYLLAEGAMEEVTYRAMKGMDYSSSETLTEGGVTVETTVSNIVGGIEVLAAGDSMDRIRKVKTTLTQGVGVAFNYGLQSGNGGMHIDGGSNIIGNLYSNGSIYAKDVTVTGTVVAADSAATSTDQANDTPTAPPSSITFGSASASQDFAQSFQISNTSPVVKIQLYIKKVGAPSNPTVRLVTDVGGSPSTTQIPIGSAILNAAQVTTNFGWVDIVLPTPPSLIPGTPYWIVIDGSSNSSKYFVIGANDTYTSGVAKTGQYGSTWNSTAGLDGYFRVYTGGISSYIGGATYSTALKVGTAGVGDAWATTIKGTSAQGKLYCQTGTNNNQVCDTSRGSPSPQPLPFSDANIDAWKADAQAGGTITGDYTVNWAGATTGPKMITGNLTIGGGGTLTLTGTLYVQGNVTIAGGGKIKLASNYGNNSGVLVSDSWVSVGGGGGAGSGHSGSYLIIVSTSKCPNDNNCAGNSAVTVSGGAGAVAVNAQSGDVSLSGGADFNAAVGNSITITGGATVTYDSGLANPSFTTGPSGGYEINSWEETQ